MALNIDGQKSFGPWGPHTATLDWCEDNYTHFDYIAETWNTFSSLPYIVLGIYGVLSTRGLPNRTRYALTHAFISLIGVGSAIFHGTLLWHAQVILDELPMIWSAALFLYLAAAAGKPRGALSLKIGMTVVPLVISAIYLKYPNPVFHQVCYGAMQLCTTTLIVGLYKVVDVSTSSRAARIKECKRIMWSGIVTFITGFAIWNIDNLFCNHLTDVRRDKGELIGLLTQGHAWWHLLTGIGASRMVTSLVYLAMSIREPDGYELAGIHPYVRRRRESDVKKVK